MYFSIYLLNLFNIFTSKAHILSQGVGKTLTAGRDCEKLNFPEFD